MIRKWCVFGVQFRWLARAHFRILPSASSLCSVIFFTMDGSGSDRERRIESENPGQTAMEFPVQVIGRFIYRRELSIGAV
jgi:hypothetical protein